MGALALGGRGAGRFLRGGWRVGGGAVAERAAALEVAARWGARLTWFGDRGVLNGVRLWLFRLRARSRRERDGTAKVRWCADCFWALWRKGGEVGGEERLQRATCAVHVGAVGRLAD